MFHVLGFYRRPISRMLNSIVMTNGSFNRLFSRSMYPSMFKLNLWHRVTSKSWKPFLLTQGTQATPASYAQKMICCGFYNHTQQFSKWRREGLEIPCSAWQVWCDKTFPRTDEVSLSLYLFSWFILRSEKTCLRRVSRRKKTLRQVMKRLRKWTITLKKLSRYWNARRGKFAWRRKPLTRQPRNSSTFISRQC